LKMINFIEINKINKGDYAYLISISF
jgi:hypothetical protein